MPRRKAYALPARGRAGILPVRASFPRACVRACVVARKEGKAYPSPPGGLPHIALPTLFFGTTLQAKARLHPQRLMANLATVLSLIGLDVHERLEREPCCPNVLADHDLPTPGLAPRP